MHYALKPVSADEPGARAGSGQEYLAEELAARLRHGPVSYDFQLQFYVDAARTPIEDASVEWREADALRGRPVNVSAAQGSTKGLARGIDVHGALLVETPHGVKRFISGDAAATQNAASPTAS